MTYNIHPLFVHFPIALFFLYSLVKILPIKKLLPKFYWKDIELFLLSIGFFGALIALPTGENAEHLLTALDKKHLIEVHSLFASISVWLYGALLIGELLPYIITHIIQKLNITKITTFFTFIQKILTNDSVSKSIAIIGLITISVTGLLGGVIVYGATADPIAPFVLRILGLN